MKFEWDTAKAGSNHAKHGVEFAYAARVFMDSGIIVAEDSRSDYGEPRFIAMGMIEGRLYVVAFAKRGKAYRIISARKGNRREQKKYDTFHSQS